MEKITILNRKDEVLGCHMMSIEFKQGESPLEDKKSKYVSCFANDELMQGLVRIHHGTERTASKGGRGVLQVKEEEVVGVVVEDVARVEAKEVAVEGGDEDRVSQSRRARAWNTAIEEACNL